MPTFPKLKTGVAAQYPLDRDRTFDFDRVRFVDMGEQVFAERAQAKRRWRLELSQLDETEAAEICEFFSKMRGAFGRFDFEDPETMEIVANCRFDQDRLEVERVDEFDSRLSVTVVETA